MTTNKDLLMQPLSDEELAGVSGGATGGERALIMAKCNALCRTDTTMSSYAECMQVCIQGGMG